MATLTYEPLVVVSPHLDDAVLSCGALLAAHPGSTVITVMAGSPGPSPHVTSWDADCGFADGTDVVAARRAEDSRALALLGAKPVWLDFLDFQYGPQPDLTDVVRALRDAVIKSGVGTVVMPMGLFHEDHDLTHRACLTLLGQPGFTFLAYAEANYRWLVGEIDGRLRTLAQSGIEAQPALELPVGEGKRTAVAQYASQLRGIMVRAGTYEDAFWPELYWSLSRSK